MRPGSFARHRRGEDNHVAASHAVQADGFHGTRAGLSPGDFIRVGYACNFRDVPLSWVYFAATLDAAVWGAELADGKGHARIYVVEPTGEIFDDPNVTDKKFPGNPTLSYRSREPLRILGEVAGWDPHPADQLQHRKDRLAALTPRGAHIID